MDHAALVARVSEVCPLPEAAARVMELTRDAGASWHELGAAVESDPALASEILRVVSSPAYQTRYRHESLRAACRVLGQRQLHDLTAAMAMLATFKSEHELALHAHEIGALAAQLAARLASTLGVANPSRAFLAGLLSEIGALACLSVDADAYIALRARCPGEPARLLAEQRRYLAHSFAIGGALLARNGLSSEICKAVHGVDNDPLSTVVRFGRRAATFVLLAADARDASWLAGVEEILQREGLTLERGRLADLAEDAVRETVTRYERLGLE